MALYKDWSAICKVGRSSWPLMLALSNCSQSENNDISMRLSIGFPECFSTTKVEGPFPLSIIRELAEEAAMSHHGSSGGSDYPENNDVLSDLYVPYIRLLVLGNPNKNIYGQFDFGMPTFHLPFDEAKELKQGVRIEWKGTTMVVLENNPYNSCITMAPAACIALDL